MPRDLDEVRDAITSVVDNYGLKHGVRYRLPAVAAAASCDDPLWDELLRLHPWHAHPRELLSSARSVVVFAVPLSLEAVESNREGDEPSVRWLREYVVTNAAIEEASRAVARELEASGYRSVPLRPTHEYDPIKLVARWSHRHAGYVAGLGTFGVNNLLITAKGCAVRLGTVITEAPVEVRGRPDYEYCLEKRGFACRACVRRCPVRALDSWSERKGLCSSWLSRVAEKYASEVGERAEACGKCATAVPCSTEIPVSPRAARR